MINQILDTPWKLGNEFNRMLVLPWVRLLFALSHISWDSSWRFYGVPIIQKHRRSTMQFGRGFALRSTARSNPLGPNHPVILCTWQETSCLKIGEEFAMTGGAICATELISIGDRVAVGANTTIVDTDFHPLDPVQRRLTPNSGKTAPVIIQNDVFIGMDCLILKGVTIGSGSVIGAGSVVSHSIPAGVIAAGNPAKVLREI